MWDGERGELVGHLIDVGFLDLDEAGVVTIHDYWDHAPDYVKKRRIRELERHQRSADFQKRQTMASNGRHSQTTAADGGRRRPTAENGSPPAPAPAPAPIEKNRSSGPDGPAREKKTLIRFQRPTVQDVAAYIGEKGYRVNPQKFCDHYESNGWRVGKNPMKNWQAAVRKWASSDLDGSGQARPAIVRAGEQVAGWTWGYTEADYREHHENPLWDRYLDDLSDRHGWGGEQTGGPGTWPTFVEWSNQ